MSALPPGPCTCLSASLVLGAQACQLGKHASFPSIHTLLCHDVRTLLSHRPAQAGKSASTLNQAAPSTSTTSTRAPHGTSQWRAIAPRRLSQ